MKYRGARAYVIAKIILTIPMILILLTMVFLFIRVLPGDPVLLHFEKSASPAAVEQMRQRALGEKQEIFSNPIHPYTQALMSAIPVPNPDRKRTAIELKGEVPSAIDIPKGCRFNPRCPYTEDRCRVEPELRTVKPGHLVACYHTEA